MTASSDQPRPQTGRDESWAQTILVWNASVARIRPAATPPAAAEADLELEDGGVERLSAS